MTQNHKKYLEEEPFQKESSFNVCNGISQFLITTETARKKSQSLGMSNSLFSITDLNQ